MEVLEECINIIAGKPHSKSATERQTSRRINSVDCSEMKPGPEGPAF